MIFVFDAQGICLACNDTKPQPPLSVFQAKYGPDALLVLLEANPYPGTPLERLRLVDGQVEEVHASHVLSLDVQLTGGDRMVPPGLAVNADPVQELVATATLRDQAGNVVPLTDPQGWRMSVYHADGRVAFIALVPISAGVATARIPANLAQLPQGVLVLDDRDFEEIMVGEESYKVVMPAPVVFKAYVKLAG